MDSNRYAIHFSPLQGYTDRIFRNTFARYFGGVDAYYTPFIREEKGEVRRRDIRDLEPDGNTVIRLIPQILPGTSEEFRFLTDTVKAKGYTEIDINLGCPFPMIAGKGKGAGMLPRPDRVGQVLRTIEEYPDIRFSLKMRLGWEDAAECLRLAELLNQLPLEHITLHARTGKQQYKGNPQPEAFQRFYELCKRPLYYNGDIRMLQDSQEILKRFPLIRGVVVGRGLLAEPLLAKEFSGEKVISGEKRRALYFAFHEELFSAYAATLQGESQLLSKMKTLWTYFLPETDRKLLKRIRKSAKLSTYTETIKEIFYAS